MPVSIHSLHIKINCEFGIEQGAVIAQMQMQQINLDLTCYGKDEEIPLE